MYRLAAAMLSVAIASSALAQTSASLTGTVTTGQRPLAGVTVTVSSPALQGTRSAVTGESGAYEFAALPPGDYLIEIRADGFGEVRRRTALRLSQTTRVDAEMNFGDTITVTAAGTPALETPQISTNLTLQQVERLPILRNQLDTARFAPGVNGNTLTNGQLYISGGPGYDNLVLVNGVVVTENTRGQMRPMYVEDAIQETTLLTGAISAEYGRFSGGVVSTITKSGGNEPTASLRDSLSSPRWAAQTPAGEARESSLNNVWEATFGGFLVRDRLWFFTAGRWAANDTARQTVAVPGADAISYTEGNDQKRWEGKLTAALGARQNVAASGFSIRTKGTNVRFNNNIYDLSSLTTRNDPESLVAVHYDGIVVPNVLAEGHYSARKFADRSGAFATDIVNGTLLLDRSNNNTRFNSPTLCGVCDVEHRDNDDVLLETRAFLDTGRAGAHELVGGVDRFTERRYANNHQSGSDFSLFVTRVQAKDGVLYPVITPSNATGGGSFIRWNPIFAAAAEDDLRTDSAFVNDVWSFGAHWQLSAGARWDRNHAVDADGVVSANDARLSPRLSAQFDVRGDGRHRISASFGEYASRIADSIASSNQAAGNAASIDFAYLGPAINANALTVPLPDAVRMVFDYFNSKQGGTANLAPGNLRANGTRTVPGFATYFDGTLRSPFVREMTLGYGEQLGRNAYVRADAVHRDWHDFYAASVTPETRRTTTPLGIPVDLVLMRNSNNVRREYRALQLQARWTPPRVDAGVFYTWSKLRGNDEGESATGANANVDPSMYYPEFFAYAQANPIGYLTGDQRHKVRAWAGYTLPLGRTSVSATLLQSYDSGLAYSVAGPINLTRYTGAPKNPGYNSIPNGIYYFSDRGALRTDVVRSTDLALRGALRIARLEYFVQADVLNIFNNDAIADPTKLGTTVSTAATSTALQPFDPAKQTPVAGVNYQLAPNFGQPLNNLAYQTPRTFRMSLGARF
ncbi:MAG TPA: carboxypeptidase regulatory-like domain-containing protein [Thermoanaerobaculia bacterium]|nr:carboxypeptidase regulatory-like domain-containing protein [Thermoanaerobaculia bacterium]